MTSRILLGAFVTLIALAALSFGVARWRHAQAWAEVTPVGDVRWEGYVIEHDRLNEDGESVPNLNHMRVSRDGSLVMEWRVVVIGSSFMGMPIGFFGGLNADTDPELELVYCERGTVQSFVEPDRATDEVVTQDGRLATPHAQEVCAALARVGRFGCAACCVIPLAIPVFITILLFARRERREEERLGRSSF